MTLSVTETMSTASLSPEERLLYRDRLRAARYAALADSEGFGEICFAVEALGMRLCGREGTLNKYYASIADLARRVPERERLAAEYPGSFTRFEALYSSLHNARNDAMHSGAYARHAALAAIELCTHLEEALMAGPDTPIKVSDYMVKAPVSVERWQPVAHARQLMLTHSFSFLPVNLEGWKLVSELSVARFLRNHPDRQSALAMRIDLAIGEGLHLLKAKCIAPSADVATLFEGKSPSGPTLWLVTERRKTKPLLGVLSPFDLM